MPEKGKGKYSYPFFTADTSEKGRTDCHSEIWKRKGKGTSFSPENGGVRKEGISPFTSCVRRRGWRD